MVIKNVDVKKRAELLHGGSVSHRTLISREGEMTTLGLMMPGVYKFATEAAETLEVVQGQCRVRIGEQGEWLELDSGQSLQLPAHGHFEVEATEVLDYIRRPE